MAQDEPTAEPDDEADDEETGRSRRTSALWTDVRIDPVEIALPGGVGYTLRAYRPSDEIAQGSADRDSEAEVDDFDAAAAAVARRRRASDGEDLSVEDDAADEPEEDELDDEELDDEFDEESFDEDLEDEEAEDLNQEVPVFLGRNGRFYLFHRPEKLVEFVRSGVEHDLSQLDTWSTLAERIGPDDIVALDEDSYELDLVVENLRGGADAWEPTLILKAGELARDLGFALRMEPVLVSLAAGSPLDDLDEALRGAERGGVGSFFAKRKLRKIPAQQSSLAWRTVIGKISAVADWRD